MRLVRVAAIAGLLTLVLAAPASAGIIADLSVTKTDAPDPVTAGANLTYTITVANSDNSTAADVSLSDPLPAGTTLRVPHRPRGLDAHDAAGRWHGHRLGDDCRLPGERDRGLHARGQGQREHQARDHDERRHRDERPPRTSIPATTPARRPPTSWRRLPRCRMPPWLPPDRGVRSPSWASRPCWLDCWRPPR